MNKNEAATDILKVEIPAGYSIGGQSAAANTIMGSLSATLSTDNEVDSGQTITFGGVVVATGEANEWKLIVNYNDNVSTSGSTNLTVKTSAEAARVHTIAITPSSSDTPGKLTLSMIRGSDKAHNKATEKWTLKLLGSTTKKLTSTGTDPEIVVPTTSTASSGGLATAARDLTTSGYTVSGGSTITSIALITNPSTDGVARWLAEQHTSIDVEDFFDSVAGNQAVVIK